MSGTSQPLMRRVAQFALALVLLAPLVAGAHVHDVAAGSPTACGVCAVARHAPALVGESTAVTPAIVHAAPVVLMPDAPEFSGRCWRPAGRAPPAFSIGQLS